MDRKPHPLVFLHGFLGTRADWAGVTRYLKSFECLSVELPGHGTTPFSKNFFNLIPNLEKIHLIGYSMGGRLAMKYADAFEDRIASLTILSSHIGLDSREEKEKRRINDALLAKEIIQSFDDFLIKWYDQPLFGGFKPDLTTRKSHAKEEIAKALCFYSLANQKKFSLKNARFLVGERDMLYRKLHPNGIVVPNAAHMVHLENPEFVAKVIKEAVL